MSELSPAAKAVDRAIADRIQLLGEIATSRQIAAAALRAAANQVVPEGVTWENPFWHRHWPSAEERAGRQDEAWRVRHQLLAIATELENHQ